MIKGNYTVDLLTSKEYVQLRDSLKLGYEWNEGNFLASSTVGYWWIKEIKNNKIYVVNTKGSYVLINANGLNYVRPVVTLDKSNIE